LLKCLLRICTTEGKMVCHAIKSFLCARTTPEDAAKRWLMPEAKDLVTRREEASTGIDTNTAQVGKQCEQDPEHVDLKVNVEYLDFKIRELRQIQEEAEKLKAEVETARKICCCCCSIFDLETGVYKTLRPLALSAAGTSFGVGVYQYQAGKDGLIWQIIALTLLLGEKGSEYARGSLKDTIFTHTYTASELNTVIKDAEKERKNAESLKLTFEKLPRTLALGPDIQRRLNFVLQAIPDAYRGKFTLDGLRNFATRNQTLPANFGSGGSVKANVPTRHPSLGAILSPMSALTQAPLQRPLLSLRDPSSEVRVDIQSEGSAFQQGVTSPTQSVEQRVDAGKSESAITRPTSAIDLVSASHPQSEPLENKNSVHRRAGSAPMTSVSVELVPSQSLPQTPVSRTPKGKDGKEKDDFTDLEIAFAEPPTSVPQSALASKTGTWLDLM
jgi:hypothetical protein